MHATELMIGDHVYRLPDGVDENEVLEQLTDAVRVGGAVVELPGVSPQSAKSVLISPGVPVFIERIQIPDDVSGPDDDGDDPNLADWPI